MGRVDLDALQRKLDADQTLDDWPDYQLVRGAAAELRVAREVVEAARWMHDEHTLRVGPDGYHDCVLCAALAAFDRHVQHLDDPGSEPNTDSKYGL